MKNISDSIKLIELLFKTFFEKLKGLIELRFISKTSGASHSKFYDLESFKAEDVHEEIRKLNFNHHVFFGVNPRPLSKNKKQDDIKNIVCLWADVDGKDFQNGKGDALKSIDEFPLPPNIIVDSGNGYHCYWILKEPITRIDKNKRLEFKKVLSGVVKKINADAHAINIDRVMRLPGTYNIKGDEPLECKIIHENINKLYTFDDFKLLKDDSFEEINLNIGEMPDFGENEIIVRSDSSEHALADAKKLEVSPRHKNMIVTGACLTGKDADKSRSGRDYSIIRALLVADYNYPSMRSIFLSPHLGCSDRIIERGEDALKWDTIKLHKITSLSKPTLTKTQQIVMDLKEQKIKAERRRVAINEFIGRDLLAGEKPAGIGMREKDSGLFYYFNSSEKWLMDIEGVDFYCYLRDRFIISKNESKEIIDAIKTEIWTNGQTVIAHRFSFYDDKNHNLYVSDHNNRIFKIDGDRVELVDNGTDGVFFEYKSEFTPINVDVNKLEGANYFVRGKTDEKRIGSLVFSEGIEMLGFSWFRFNQEDSYLRRHLIDRTNFVKQIDCNWGIDQQKFLLTIYFYSLFFESILPDKPIVCIEGSRESGKSFVATSIGKILFGDAFQCRSIPDDLKDLSTILGGNYYMVFDNLDHYVKHKIIDVLCQTATGIAIEKRELYTNRDVIKILPHIFLAITTREAKFKRDDLVSRLLLFTTRKINRPLGKALLYKDIKINRDNIMAEVLINLNSIVKLLKRQSSYAPFCISRIADWELFGRKVTVGLPWGVVFQDIMRDKGAEKDLFGLEDDYLFILLNQIVNVNRDYIEDESAAELYKRLHDKAKDSDMWEFMEKYKGAVSIGKRLSHVKAELNRFFDFEIRSGHHNVKYYSISPKFEEEGDEMKNKLNKIKQNALGMKKDFKY